MEELPNLRVFKKRNFQEKLENRVGVIFPWNWPGTRDARRRWQRRERRGCHLTVAGRELPWPLLPSPPAWSGRCRWCRKGRTSTVVSRINCRVPTLIMRGRNPGKRHINHSKLLNFAFTRRFCFTAQNFTSLKAFCFGFPYSYLRFEGKRAELVDWVVFEALYLLWYMFNILYS